jgi:hypothetical protein
MISKCCCPNKIGFQNLTHQGAHQALTDYSDWIGTIRKIYQQPDLVEVWQQLNICKKIQHVSADSLPLSHFSPQFLC